MQNNSFSILKRLIQNFLKWEKSDRGQSHIRHGLDPPLGLHPNFDISQNIIIYYIAPMRDRASMD